jgi:hypothetical protein
MPVFGRFGAGVSGVWLFLRKVVVWGGFQIGERAKRLVVLGRRAGAPDRRPGCGGDVKGRVTSRGKRTVDRGQRTEDRGQGLAIVKVRGLRGYGSGRGGEGEGGGVRAGRVSGGASASQTPGP